MFRVEQNVPDVYINESRDFQLISRLYDLAFQDVRQSTDSLDHITATMQCRENLLPLLATKLGFFEELNLPEDIYRKVLSAFPTIIKYKGSKYAILLIVNLFERISNTNIIVHMYEDNAIIVFQTYSSSSELLMSLIEYIRPAGYIIEWETNISIFLDTADFNQTDDVRIVEKVPEADAGMLLQLTTDSDYKGNIGFAQISSIGEDNQS